MARLGVPAYPSHVRDFNDTRRRETGGDQLVRRTTRGIILSRARAESMAANRRDHDWHTAERSEIRPPALRARARAR